MTVSSLSVIGLFAPRSPPAEAIVDTIAPCPAFAHSVRSGTGISLSQKAAGFLATCLTPVKLGADKPKAKSEVPAVRAEAAPARGTQVLG